MSAGRRRTGTEGPAPQPVGGRAVVRGGRDVFTDVVSELWQGYGQTGQWPIEIVEVRFEQRSAIVSRPAVSSQPRSA